MNERMPALPRDAMTEEQRALAEVLAAGPRGGVKGPFIALLRSPQLMDRLQKVGEYLRFQSALEPRLAEFAMLVVSRRMTQQFEWAVHHPLALDAGIAPAVLDGLADGRRPAGMEADEAFVYDFCDELLRTCGVCDATFREAVERFGERGLIDLIGLIGYFTTVSYVLNVAHTPAPQAASARALQPHPH